MYFDALQVFISIPNFFFGLLRWKDKFWEYFNLWLKLSMIEEVISVIIWFFNDRGDDYGVG